MMRFRKNPGSSSPHRSNDQPRREIITPSSSSPPKHRTPTFFHLVALTTLLVFVLNAALFVNRGYHHPIELRIVAVDSHDSLKNNVSITNIHETYKTTVVVEQPNKTSFSYILGVSAGHTGSTTIHDAINRHCSWVGSDGTFEATAPSEHQQVYNPRDPCDYTRDTLLPWLERHRADGTVWVDLGHYHNLGRTLECLATSRIGSTIVFLGIRRDRYQIARSFGKENVSPCIHDENEDRDSTLPDDMPARRRRRRSRHFRRSRRRRVRGEGRPFLSYCPHSREVRVNGPTFLPFRDDDWIRLDRFQKFLWLADEMEYRFRMLERESADRSGEGPTFLHVSWSTADELRAGIDEVRAKLGCAALAADGVPHRKSHVRHDRAAINCTSQIMMDLEYRAIAKYDDEMRRILFERPQRVKVSECQETFDELVRVLTDNGESMENWVLDNVSDSINNAPVKKLPPLKKEWV